MWGKALERSASRKKLSDSGVRFAIEEAAQMLRSTITFKWVLVLFLFIRLRAERLQLYHKMDQVDIFTTFFE